jgi:hypothetical protein
MPNLLIWLSLQCYESLLLSIIDSVNNLKRTSCMESSTTSSFSLNWDLFNQTSMEYFPLSTFIIETQVLK